MTQPLAGRAALVTGAAGGIGQAIVSRLRSEGMDVVAVDLRVGDGDDGGPSVQADLTTRAGNRRAVEATVERFGRLDAVIACAGVQHVAPVESFSEDTWDMMLALMLTSPFLLARYAWPHLSQSQGRLIAIGSAHSLVASPYKAAYVAAKHGLLGLVKTLALEGAASGITATAVCPGFVRTPLLESQLNAQAEAHGVGFDEVLDDVILASHAVKRLIEPSEVAEVVHFLLGQAGASFTGVPLTMDLGWTAR